jgi:hypothetical protein
MPRFFFYKLVVDDGGAPCVEGGLLSLAICKPMIRSSADENDLIFGFAANSLHPDNRLIYIARITKKLSGDDGRNGYYSDHAYAARADCIYRWDCGTYSVRDGARFHGLPGDLEHDLGEAPLFKRANVLLSDDFRYFGGSLPEHYKTRFKKLAKAVETLGRGHRAHPEPALISELEALKMEAWRKGDNQIVGTASQSPRCGISHRGGVCGSIKKRSGYPRPPS